LATNLGGSSWFRPGWFVDRLARLVERWFRWLTRNGDTRIAGFFRRNGWVLGFWNDWFRHNGWIGDAGLFNTRDFDTGSFGPTGFFNARCFRATRFLGTRFWFFDTGSFGFAGFFRPWFWFFNARNFRLRLFGIGFFNAGLFRVGWRDNFFGFASTTDLEGNVTFLTVSVGGKEIVEGADADVTTDGHGRLAHAGSAVVAGHVKGPGPGYVDVLGNVEIHGVTIVNLDGVADGPSVFNVIDAVHR